MSKAIATFENCGHEPLAYSIADAVKVTGLGRTRIFILIRTGDLDVTRIGRRTLVKAESLKRLVREGI